MLLPQVPPPPADDQSITVHITSLASALSRLNINIPIQILIKIMREEDEVRLATKATEQRAMLSKLALPETFVVNTDGTFTFVPKPTEPAFADLVERERGRRLVEMAREAGF
ncbi:hypothetical protein DFH94DRAFT_685564 [Russula ochroleuca]|uniref:Uncharacterized protein n=1 Tax=Russula ochroleuca TaxID=152965 RepID=A0A9P5MQE4_9AGAM|nr:hypothetical protein DFH94DRAFT_685564 [Russula ochroleuca]